MDNQTNPPESPEAELLYDMDEQFIISADKFIILVITTFGLYNIWWMYKAWRFYNQKEGLNIRPAFRALFAIFFTYQLFDKILRSALEKGYSKSYSPAFLFVSFCLVSFLSYLPHPLTLLALFAVIFIIPPYKAFNYTRENSSEFAVSQQESFNSRQLLLIIFGCILWLFVLLSLYSGFSTSLRAD
jgi:hypothetical protein